MYQDVFNVLLTFTKTANILEGLVTWKHKIFSAGMPFILFNTRNITTSIPINVLTVEIVIISLQWHKT